MDKHTQKELLEIVRTGYDKIAEEFNETRKKNLWPELKKLGRMVDFGDKVLDVGCGNGHLLEAFSNKTITYLGVDMCEKLIGIASEEYPEHEFIVGDIISLGNIPQVDFDYVFCIAVLHHLPGTNMRVSALKQLKNKISRKGRIILVVWNMWSPAWGKKNFRKLIIKFTLLKLIKKNKMDFGDIVFDWKNSDGQVVGKRYYHAFRRKELKKIIKKAGLKIERLYKDQYNYYVVLRK